MAFQLIEEVTAHAQSDSLKDAREICADGTYFPNNLRTIAGADGSVTEQLESETKYNRIVHTHSHARTNTSFGREN